MVVSTLCNCNALNNSTTKVDHAYVCLEEDFVWATITFGFIQMPAVVLALCGAVGVVLYEGCTKKVLGCLLLLITPFPLLVLLQQVVSVFMPDSAQMELLSSIFLFGEGALEASPQILLLLYIIVSDRERDIPWIQKVSIISSVLTISKTAIELFVSESYFEATPSDVLNHSTPTTTPC